MNRNDYWRKREEEQLKHYLTEEADIQRAMAEKYNYMLYQIQAQINDFYARYARREQITLAEAMQRVSKMDVQAFASKAKKYVEKRDFSPKANRELRLYNATMRINRLELLKANIGLEMVDGFNDLEHLMDNSLTKRTTDELKRQEEILRRDAGILGESISNNAKTVRSIVNASFNNATWSERIWGNQTQLRNELASLLTQGLIQGRNPRVLAPALEKMFGVSKRNAERLMATELARVQTDAQMQTFKENDIDEYIFLSMDTACHECMALNEQHFPVKDAMPGENAPPIHPNCRCSTAAYVDREMLERELFGESSGNTEKYARSIIGDIINGTTEERIDWPSARERIGRERAKNIRNYAKSKGINVFGIANHDLDEHTMQVVIDDLAKYLKRYPELLTGRKGVRVTAANRFNNNYAGTKNKMITLNVNAYRDLSFLEAEYEKRVQKGWFPKGTNYHALMAHEVGHCIHEHYPEIDPREIAMRISGKKTSTSLAQYLTEHLSEYSATKLNGEEIISECYACVLTGVNNEFALKFTAECDKIIKQKRKEAQS